MNTTGFLQSGRKNNGRDILLVASNANEIVPTSLLVVTYSYILQAMDIVVLVAVSSAIYAF